MWLAILTTLSVLWFGARVVTDYIAALPGIQSGAAVAAFTENRDIAASNQSIYGATRKLAAIGIDRFTPARGQMIQTLYGGALFLLALVLGLRGHRGAHSDRLTHAIVCLALLNLASFRSPFLPDAYAFVGTFWLGTLIVARSDAFDWRVLTFFVVLWMAMAPIWGGLDVPPEPYVLIVAFSLIVQASVFALNLHSARS